MKSTVLWLKTLTPHMTLYFHYSMPLTAAVTVDIWRLGRKKAKKTTRMVEKVFGPGKELRIVLFRETAYNESCILENVLKC